MSYKTGRLVDLLPDVYAAAEPDSLLHRLLDTVGAELMSADAAVKRLLKSHWVDYADGAALDGLGAIYGVGRRVLHEGMPEGDEAFRRRLRSVVQLFTGGGTRKAIKGAVRSALGLPYDLDTLGIPPGLRDDLDALVEIHEFPLTREHVVGAGDDVVLNTDAPMVDEAAPRIECTFQLPARGLTVERLGPPAIGVQVADTLLIPAGGVIVLADRPDGTLTALLDGHDITAEFTNLDGSIPARLPVVPRERRSWRFRAYGARYGLSFFDEDVFDGTGFRVELTWLRAAPLTIDVVVPYFLPQVVQQLVDRYHYTGQVFVFQGLPLSAIAQVVDQTRAAGVTARTHFSLRLAEDHPLGDGVRRHLVHHVTEDAAATDRLRLGSLNRTVEDHDATDHFGIAATYDESTFGEPYSYE